MLLEKNNCGSLRSPVMPLYHRAEQLSIKQRTPKIQLNKCGLTLFDSNLALVLGQHFY